jgi:hypothetical protein
MVVKLFIIEFHIREQFNNENSTYVNYCMQHSDCSV